jgi:leucyl-tRNA synthetase
MSKSLGNFYTIMDVVGMYGADSTRIALAEAGDSLDDANFVLSNAENAILKLSHLHE